MDNISVVSDNVYAKIAIIKMVSQLCSGRRLKKTYAIYSFERTWLNENELSSILNCKAGRILILAPKSLLTFLSTLNFKEKISFSHYDAPLSALKMALNAFLNYVKKEDFKSIIYPTESKSLSPNECSITLLYFEGLSIKHIARLMNKSHKTISAHKRNAMKKMGVATNSELIKKRGGILLANKLNIINKQKLTLQN
ncbi:putative LuxR-family regulatory protein [Yersinia enterocolitica]|nr:putative LuxR-family regulatory protein [Yersinia enterocolitica]